eukprot:3707098-Alexandrium_andersonii.AAC.1
MSIAASFSDAGRNWLGAHTRLRPARFSHTSGSAVGRASPLAAVRPVLTASTRQGPKKRPFLFPLVRRQ